MFPFFNSISLLEPHSIGDTLVLSNRLPNRQLASRKVDFSL